MSNSAGNWPTSRPKRVVGRRLKQSGMFWSKRGTDDLLSLRHLLLGPYFDATRKARPASW